MNEARLREALRREPIPDETGAEERAWRIVRAAYAERPAMPQRSRRRRAPLAWALAGLVLIGVLISPAGAAVRHWVRDAVQIGEKPSSPALTSLPAPGRLLVQSPSGPWVVQEDGSKRLLGDYREATWSPQGLFVAATTDHQLVALDPSGGVRWSISRRGPIRAPSWNGPDGFRIAYLDGSSLRVIAGNGAGDRLLRRDVAPVKPAWKPGPSYRLAYAAHDGSVHVVAADSGHQLFATRPGPVPISMQWTAGGERLVIAGKRDLEVLDPLGGAPVQRYRAPRGDRITGFSLSGSGDRVAILTQSIGGVRRSSLRLARGGRRPHTLFSGPGRFSDVAFSPNGRFLLLGWRDADQWLFLRPRGDRRIEAVSNIAAEFSPGQSHPAFPSVEGWCCSSP